MRTTASTRATSSTTARTCDRCGRPIPLTASTRRPCPVCPPLTSRRPADRVFK